MRSEIDKIETFLCVDDMAEILCIKPKTIRSWVYKRSIPYIKINGTVRFRRKDVEKWLAEKSKTPINSGIA